MNQYIEWNSVAGVVDVANSYQDIVYGPYASSLDQVKLIIQAEKYVFHVLPYFSDQVQFLLQKLLEQEGEVTPVSVALTLYSLKQIPEHLVVVVGHVSWCE